jgi:hypothetical protein
MVVRYVTLNSNRLKSDRTGIEMGEKGDEGRTNNIRKILPRHMQRDKRITRDISALQGSVNDLASAFKQVKEAQSNLEQRRKGRNIFARSGSSVQTFAANLNDFLDAYSAVRGIAKAADATYGGAAIESLSLLLIVYTIIATKLSLC